MANLLACVLLYSIVPLCPIRFNPEIETHSHYVAYVILCTMESYERHVETKSHSVARVLSCALESYGDMTLYDTGVHIRQESHYASFRRGYRN